jgi:hypothetical protein
MNPSLAEVWGTLRPDGSLELNEKPRLRPGRVRVTLSVEPVPPEGTEDLLAMGQRFAREVAAEGGPKRTAADIDAEIRSLRAELDERLDAIERMREGFRFSPEKPAC